MLKKLAALMLAIVMLISLAGCGAPNRAERGAQTQAAVQIDENGSYSGKDQVALYIYTYGHLPDKYITKREAKALGWTGGSLEPYAPGKCIGGDRFGNYEELLPSFCSGATGRPDVILCVFGSSTDSKRC